MFGIGQFAQIAKVSVRTLRHYDQLGLLRPAEVDLATGYRFYRPAQLVELNRVLVLKELGFTLAEIGRVVEAGVSTDELLGMLRLRQAEAQRAAAEEQRRLARVAARITLLEEATMSNPDHPDYADQDDRPELDQAIVIKPLEAQHLATISEPADGFDIDFAPIFERLYGELFGELARVGVQPVGPPGALYEPRDDGRIDVVATVAVPSDAALGADGTDGAGPVRVRHLPAVARAATLIYCGDMADCAGAYQRLQRWIDAAGERPVGFSRELYLDCADERSTWVTELQFVLADHATDATDAT